MMRRAGTEPPSLLALVREAAALRRERATLATPAMAEAVHAYYRMRRFVLAPECSRPPRERRRLTFLLG